MDMLIVLLLGLLFLALGAPVAYAFGLAAMIGLLTLGQPLSTAVASTFIGLDTFALLAIPLFIFAGLLLTNSGLASRLVALLALLTGNYKGSTGVTLVASSTLFGALSGSSVATVATMGTAISPEMKKEGYEPGYVGALTAVSGTLGVFIPPSIGMIIFGIVTETSIKELFLAGISAGLLLAMLLIVVHVVRLKFRPLPGNPAAEVRKQNRRIGKIVVDSIPVLLVPLVILGGIYSGLATPTEAAAIACVVAIIIGMMWTRSLPPRKLGSTLLDSAVMSASLLIILGMGMAFSTYLTMSGLSRNLIRWMQDVTDNRWVFLLLANIVIATIALVVEENTTIVVMGPLLTPIAVAYGFDPVHFGAIVVVNMGMSLSMPPMAPNLFVAAKTCGVSYLEMVKPVLMLLFCAFLPVLIFVNLAPELVLFWR